MIDLQPGAPLDPCAQAAALLDECRGDLKQAYRMSGFSLMLTPPDRPDLFELWWAVREILQLAGGENYSA